MEILLVEDDPILGRGLQATLELEGFTVRWAQDLRTANLSLKQKEPDLALLDLGLPDGSGLTFLQDLRKAGGKTPVIILTAQTDEDSVVEGLNTGANDYVRKPFGQKELLARIRSLLREPVSRASELRFGELVLNDEQRRVMFHDKEIDFNRREFDVIRHFLRQPEAVVTRDALLEALGKGGEIFDRTIDSHVSHVRSKLRQAGVKSVQINSVYGVGYRLEKK